MKRTPEGHDPCIANLPGVVFACCGHGVKEGYVCFESGTIIRGDFRVEQAGWALDGDAKAKPQKDMRKIRRK